MLELNNFAEFRGQIVDIFEDYCEQQDIRLLNESRTRAINKLLNSGTFKSIDEVLRSGSVAMITGSDYDALVEPTDYMRPILAKGQNVTVTSDDAKELAKKIYDAFYHLSDETSGSNLPFHSKDLENDLVALFKKWGIVSDATSKKVYHITHRVDGRYHTEVLADSLEEAIEKANTAFEEADLGGLEVVGWYANAAENEAGEIIWDRP